MTFRTSCSALILFAAGCGAGNQEPGTVEFTVWGEEYIEGEIPAAAFEDGWRVQFEKFLIVVGAIAVRGAPGEGGRLPETRLYNLVTPGPHRVGSLELDPGTWSHVGYATPAFSADTETHGSASAEDRDLMEQGPYAVHVAGTATKEAEQFTFAWGFTEGITYAECVTLEGDAEKPGFSLPSGGTEAVQLTIHGDHFFYDDLASPDALLRFDPIAAADTGDRHVTLEELSTVKLVDVPEGEYGTGGLSDVDDLGAFVTALTRTLGHFRGEGHCIAR